MWVVCSLCASCASGSGKTRCAPCRTWLFFKTLAPTRRERPPIAMVRVLNVAEKPSVAKGISDILSRGSKRTRNGFSQYNRVFEFTCAKPVGGIGLPPRRNCQMVFTSVSGHVMGLDFEPSVKPWRSCDPSKLFEADVVRTVKEENNKKIVKTLKREVRRCQWLILWLDCDREGENIASEVAELCTSAKSNLIVKRARFSAVIPREIHRAIESLVEIDVRQSEAVNARTEIDLRIGSAFTRWMTLLLQGKFAEMNGKTVSYGPCQFPTLGFIVDRVRRINKFVAEDFWSIEITDERRRETNGKDVERATFKWKRGRLFDRLACFVIFEMCHERPEARVTSVRGREQRKMRPLPLDTIELQKRASRFLRMSSENTMKIAEKLYQAGFLSYPRTETNRYPKGFDLRGIVQQQSESSEWGSYASQLLQGAYKEPRSGPKDDKAHPPIHPTKLAPPGALSGDEAKLYEFVARHYLACCSKDAIGQQTTVVISVASETFTAWGLMITARNFLDVYKYERWTGKTLPRYCEDDRFTPTSCEMRIGRTTPPSLLTENELITLMDQNGIGTDATIAEHIKKIQIREYATRTNQSRFQPTRLGMALCDAFASMGRNDLAKPYLRANMEAGCTDICENRTSRAELVRRTLNDMRRVYVQVARNPNALISAVSQNLNISVSNASVLDRERAPTSARTVRRALSKCGKCSSMMALVVAKETASSTSGGPRKKHYLRCNSARCTSSSDTRQPRYLRLPRGKKYVAVDHICPLCQYQVIDVCKEGSDRTYKVCPWCYSNPPSRPEGSADVADIENAIPSIVSSSTTMPCFKCPAVSRCTLAAGSEPVRVARCPSCHDGDIALRMGTKTSRGRQVRTWRLNCSNSSCDHVVWLPRKCKSVTLSDTDCPSCSRSGRRARKLVLDFRRSDVSPFTRLPITSCVMTKRCCDDALLELGTKITTDDRGSSGNRSRLPQSSSASSTSHSYGVMRGLSAPLSDSSSENMPGNDRMRRPSVLRPLKRVKKNRKKNQPHSHPSMTTSDMHRHSTRSYGSTTTAAQIPKCPGHNAPCAQRTVRKEGPNKGRPFFVCSKPQGSQCDFFQWADEEASTSSYGRTTPSTSVQIPKCPGHDVPCAQRTVRKEGPNKGRPFFVCSKPRDSRCDFFQWADE